jgi:hypothetical protein
MNDEELGALLRFGRQNNIVLVSSIIIAMCGTTGMVLAALDYPLFAWVLYGFAGIVMVGVAYTIERSDRTRIFIHSRQPIKTIKW